MNWTEQISGWWPTIWAGIIFVAGYVVKAIIDKTATYQSGRAIEGVKADFQKSLEELKAQIKSRDETLAALRKSVLDGFGARTASLTQRKIEAVERLWTAVIELAPFVAASKMTAPIKFDVALKTAAQEDAEGQKLRQFADMYWNMLKLDDLKVTVSPEKERPFLSETVWARFSLYRSMVSYPVSMLAAMRNGVDPKLINDPKPLLDAVKTAMPQYTDYIDQYGIGTIESLRDEIRDLILKEVTNIVEGKSLDSDHLEQARKIIASTEKFNQAQSEQPIPPGIT
jgi:hypothetical protein